MGVAGPPPPQGYMTSGHQVMTPSSRQAVAGTPIRPHGTSPSIPSGAVPMMRTRSKDRGSAQWVSGSGQYDPHHGQEHNVMDMAMDTTRPSGLEYSGGATGGGSGKPSHSYRMRSSSRPTDRDLRDPATAQNTDYTPPTTRFKSGFSKK
jgi:hypothetical protein